MIVSVIGGWQTQPPIALAGLLILILYMDNKDPGLDTESVNCT
jgi:hypothetical protein